jgi:hypothetical protein
MEECPHKEYTNQVVPRNPQFSIKDHSLWYKAIWYASH